jgi:deoxyribonuclease-4
MKKAAKLYIGAHMSIASGVFNALIAGEKYGCDTIQIFVKSSNQWKARPFAPDELQKYHEQQKRTDIRPVIAHASYLVNLASADKELLRKSRKAFLIEMERCEKLKIPYLVVHPGSYKNSSEREGIRTIIKSINWLLERTDGYGVKITLETTAGQGSSLGHRFEQLARMMEKSVNSDRLAVCFDTCHAYAAGYDIATGSGFTKTWHDFERIIGIDKLAVIHLNDSKKGLDSRVDRHEHIGKGQLGEKAFRLIMQDKRFNKIPKILETPKGDDGTMDIINLGLLRKFAAKKK